MRIRDLIKMGLRNLSRRKARTALTVTGVVIGTISIVIMVSIGIGMKSNYESGVMEQGSLTTIKVEKYSNIVDEDGNWIDMKEQQLNDKLADKFRLLDHVKTVTTVYQTNAKLTSGKNENNPSLFVVDRDTFNSPDFPKLVNGTLPNSENNDIIVFGSAVLESFYNPWSRFYQQIVIDLSKDKVKFQFNPWEYQVSEKKKPFIMTVKNYATMELTNNWEYDYVIYMEREYFQALYKKHVNTLKLEDRKRALSGMDNYTYIHVIVDNVKNVEKVQDEIKKLGFQSTSLAMQLKPMEETSNMLQMVLGGIGAISLLVSSINIANTMIMSIYERTKEIGIMKVLGCYLFDIRKLFLFEAGIIGLCGGTIGIVISYIASWGINKFGQPLFKALLSSNNMYNIDTAKFSIIPLWLPLLAAGTSVLIGVISGFYPALRATKISAIEAMKTDG